jgi:hypothetical protein
MTTMGADRVTGMAGPHAVSRYKKMTESISLEKTDRSLIFP